MSEFRARLVAGEAEHLLLDTMLKRFRAQGLVRPRGRQRTDSTRVLAAVHDLHLLELVAERLARCARRPGGGRAGRRGRGIARPVWFERYGRRVEHDRLPKRREEREALALETGRGRVRPARGSRRAGHPTRGPGPADGGDGSRGVWGVHHARQDDGRPRWRTGAELPPVGERLQSPYDLERHYSTKRGLEWSGYPGRASPRAATRMRPIW